MNLNIISKIKTRFCPDFLVLFCFAYLCSCLSANFAQAFDASANDTTIPLATQIIDGSGNQWTLADGAAMLNGKQAAYASGVNLILYYNGGIYIKNGASWWFAWNGAGWARIVADPRNSGVNGVCGGSNGQISASKPANLCNAGIASAVSGTGPWNWVCAGSNGGANASCATAVLKTGVSANGTTIPSATQITDNGGNIWNLSGGVAVINGRQAAYASGVKLVLYLNDGIYIENGATWWFAWNGSGWARIAADPRSVGVVNGVCGSSNSRSLSVAPFSGLCLAGMASAVSGSGPWIWGCAGNNGGSNAQCIASVAVTVVNGKCGAANATITNVTPVNNLCSTGTPGSVIGNGPWTWGCAGANGGNSDICSATLPATNSSLFYGVNLAGAEFGSKIPGTYGVDYYYPVASELDYFRSKGLTTIRLPFLWERMQTPLNTPLNSAQISYMNAFLDAADARNMHVIIDVHNYGRYYGSAIGSPYVPVASFASFWSQVASQFKAHPSLFGYDLMNEPHDMGSALVWPMAAQAAVNAIRKVDVVHYIIVEGDGWSGSSSWQAINGALNIADPANLLVYEAHSYWDGNHGGVYALSYAAQGVTPQTGINVLQPFVNWINQHGYRGYIGEYGVPGNDPNWLPVLNNALAYIKQNSISGTYWAGGPWWNSCNASIIIEPCNGQDASQISILQRYVSP